MMNLGEDHEDLEVKGQVVDLFGRAMGSFRDNKIFDKSGKVIGNIRGRFLLDNHGKKITDLSKVRKQVPQEFIDAAVAALWLLAR